MIMSFLRCAADRNMPRDVASGIFVLIQIPVCWLAFTLGAYAAVGDWPQWRYDANRSAAAPQELPATLNLTWQRDLGRPEPAFSHQARICADVSYLPVAAEGLVFVPSNVADSLTAYDIASGREKWRYVTEGPVRFAPVVMAGRLCFGSDDGYLYCLNAADGALVWKRRGAPEALPDSRLLVNGRLSSLWAVRGAPVFHDGVVYFGAGVWAEEGVYVIAVNGQSGEVLWRNDALSHVANGMSDHGRGYDIGLPPQGYPAVIDGRLLMASGRSPAAFFDLKTGKLDPYTTMYVKVNAPRGYWYMSGIGQYWFQGGNILGTRASALGQLPPDKMPLPEFCRRFGFTEKELLGLSPAEGRIVKKHQSGSAISITKENNQVYAHFAFSDPLSAGMVGSRELLTNEVFYLANRPLLRVDPVHRANMHAETGVFSEPVWTEDVLFWSEFNNPKAQVVQRGDTQPKYPKYDSIVARDLSRARWTVTQPDNLREHEFPVRWRLEAPYKVMIKAGSRLYGGGENEVAAIQIPSAGEGPRVVWKAPVKGMPVTMLAAAGHLMVVTDAGRFYCFGGAKETTLDYVRSTVQSQGDGRWNEVAQGAISEPKVPGYALVLGWNSGSLARAFAARNGWQTIVLEPDSAKAAQARNELAATGLHGKRVQVVAGLPGKILLSPHWADAIVSENLSAFPAAFPKTLELVARTLRPFTGTALLPVSPDSRASLNKACPAGDNYRVDEALGLTRIRRVAPPVGAGDWTHEAASSANTYASNDQLVRAPLQLLWLSGEVDRIGTPEFEYQHSRSPFPLYWRGMMFNIAANVINATDIYTGRYLWRYELPKTKKTLALTWVHRPFSRPDDDNFLILEGRLYLVSNTDCHVLDAITGKKLATLAIPQELRRRGADAWTELRGDNGRLYVVFGKTLAALDPLTGKVQWQRDGTMKNQTFTVGAGKIFCVDYDAPPQFGGTKSTGKALLTALTADSGRELWHASATIPPLPEYNVAGVQGGAIAWVAPLKPLLAYNAKHDVLLSVINRAAWMARQGASGKMLWEQKIKWAPSRIHTLEPPTLLEDCVIPSQGDYADSSSAFNIQTGQPVDLGNITPSKRGCGRIVGNEHLLTYRDGATAIYDLKGKKLLRNNSIRSGCTNGMIPAGGILNAPNFANGCVCNYPVFASYALYHPGERLTAIPDFYDVVTPRAPAKLGARVKQDID
jgi:outer membrane protein assembly factor BamB